MFDNIPMSAGYVGSVDDPDNLGTTLLWYGDIPDLPSITAEASNLGIKLTVESWPFSHDQIESASNKLMSLTSLTGDYDFHVYDVVGLNPNFKGLTVQGGFGNPTEDTVSAESQVAAAAESATGMPIRVTVGSPSGTLTGRTTDYAPFNAGGLMLSLDATSDNLCSSGFSIYVNGSSQVLTARHCDKTNYVAYSAHNNQYSGNYIHNIGPGAARWMGSIGYVLAWMGSYNVQDFTRTVIGIADVGINDYVCFGGGNSGAHCNIQVTDLSVSWNDGTGNGNTETIEGVQRTSDEIASIQGDSGGPVYIRSGDSNAYAVGMIQGYPSGATTHSGSGTWPNGCGGAWDYCPSNGRNLCVQSVLFTSIRTIIGGVPGSSLVHG